VLARLASWLPWAGVLLALGGCESQVSGRLIPPETSESAVGNQPAPSAGAGGAGARPPSGPSDGEPGAGGTGASSDGDGDDGDGGASGEDDDAGTGGDDGKTGGSGGGPNLTSCAELYASVDDPEALCRSGVQSAEHLPGRVLPAVQTSVTQTVSLQAIFEQFKTACGRCHGPQEAPDSSNGFFVLASLGQMLSDERLGTPAITRIYSQDPDEVMPPGRDLGERPEPPASARELAEMLTQWIDPQGGKRSVEGYKRTITVSPETPYRYPDELREAMTNIGDCIPAPELVGCNNDQMRRMDAKFAAMRSFADLPKHLEETDLFTLESARLAEQRVLSYAPTYTLFSDNAKKMRHVRVPAGEVIRYNPETGDFDIPDNTRFYKTFLRQIVGRDGKVSTRRIETRLIVVRKDQNENGVAVPKAIYGTYLWSLDEARAELTDLPYNDQTPFRDVALRHVIDEFRATDPGVRGGAGALDPDTFDGIDAAHAEDEALRAAEPAKWLGADRLLTRGYAVPGRDRCIQCHMGSSNQSFILGFNPYQVERRAGSEGGVFDDHPAEEDELTQLERFVDYGVISNVPEPHVPSGAGASARPVAFALEESQGDRLPRNEYELKAQGYMMGNCAFCHNPRGFPSVENPSLKDLLSFYPSEHDARRGIFQFPLERVSPRTARTKSYNVRFPYITPSLFERYPGDPADPAKRFQIPGGTQVYVAAPWRSLLFRNVQTPFTYESDEAIHPHMPLNVAGYDVRAPQIMGDWMLSIPARLKPRAENTTSFALAWGDGEDAAREQWEEAYGEEEQLWLEVKPGDPTYSYDAYRQAADLRRNAFHSPRLIPDEEYNRACQTITPPIEQRDCVDGYGNLERGAYLGATQFPPDRSDVFAPEMLGEHALEQPRDEYFWVYPGVGDASVRITQDSTELSDSERQMSAGWKDWIPDRPHWILRDLTLLPGAWAPRRSTWQAAFADINAFMPPALDLAGLTDAERERAQAAQEVRRANARRVFELLPRFTLTDALKHFAAEDFPYGLWREPEDGVTAESEAGRCPDAVAHAPTVGELASEPPLWFRDAQVDPSAESALKVYAQRPGQTMFNLICSNCHGQAADGRSLLAGTILELTGGRTRVANLKDGLFGEKGANREAVFHDETLAVRYLLWMGLGGTEATIPSVVLNRVGATRPLGVDRRTNPNAQATANMLDNAVGFCKDSLAFDLFADPSRRGPGFPQFDAPRGREPSALVSENGDAELWVRLCGIDNPPPIRVLRFYPEQFDQRFQVVSAYWRELDGRAQFKPTDRFGDQRGSVNAGIPASNVFPWCIQRPRSGGQDDLAGLGQVWRELGRPGEPPLCPDSLFIGAATGLEILRVAPLDQDDRRRDLWATRGAMNVGASVFLYLDALSKGDAVPKPAFDACALPAGAHR
jgi:mono/diheme cytochrome c family protein